MKAQIIIQFIGKTEPNKANGKENYHYGAISSDTNILKSIATDFTFLDFWTKENLNIGVGDSYYALVNIKGDYTQFVELGKKIGE